MNSFSFSKIPLSKFLKKLLKDRLLELFEYLDFNHSKFFELLDFLKSSSFKLFILSLLLGCVLK